MMFNDDFVQQLTNILNQKCDANSSVNASQVCNELKIDPAFKTTISSMVNTGTIPGFESRRGAGICRIGVRAKSAKVKTKDDSSTSKNTTKLLEYPDGFLDTLQAALDDMCSESVCTPRRDIAEAIGEFGYVVENMISQAIRENDVVGYQARAGRNGGIFKSTEATSTSVASVAPVPVVASSVGDDDLVNPDEGDEVGADMASDMPDDMPDEMVEADSVESEMESDDDPDIFARAEKLYG